MLRSLRRSTLLTLLVFVPGGAALVGPTSARAPAIPLSAKRFAAIDRLLRASGPLEAREITEAERRRFVRACRSLSSTDRLLRAKRAQCLAVIEASAADKVLSTCGSYEECGSRLRPLRTAFDREITATRRLVVAVGREVEDRRCRAALRPPASDLRLLDAYDRGLTELQAAYAEGSELRVTLALRRLADVPIGDLRSVRRQRADLRRDCR
ncbi:MAG: hypothetical protein M3417_14005 [Actinomycetota bacterium]|nr:hypothetical protein [Actinomycetota bacterium]